MAASGLGDDAREDGASPRRGPPAWIRLWLPVLVSFVVQVPASLFAWQGARFDDHVVALRDGWAPALALALIGPLALIGARRFPGPVVAVVAVAAVADLLLGTGMPGPPYTPSDSRSSAR